MLATKIWRLRCSLEDCPRAQPDQRVLQTSHPQARAGVSFLEDLGPLTTLGRRSISFLVYAFLAQRFF